MTLAEAVKRARAIQAELEAGRLTVPYPEQVARELAQIEQVLADTCKTTEQAQAVVRRLHAPATATLPW